jgi:hypothetical protein
MRSFALTAALLLSLGTAHGEALDSSSQPEAEHNAAQVLISRDDSLPKGCTAVLSIGDNEVATLANGDSANLSLPAGSPYLRATLKEEPECSLHGLGSGQSLLLEPGEQRSFILMYGNETMFFAPQNN